MPIAQPYKEFANRWGSEDFHQYCKLLETQTDEALQHASKVRLQQSSPSVLVFFSQLYQPFGTHTIVCFLPDIVLIASRSSKMQQRVPVVRLLSMNKRSGKWHMKDEPVQNLAMQLRRYVLWPPHAAKCCFGHMADSLQYAV